jgi:hypothetical protein
MSEQKWLFAYINRKNYNLFAFEILFCTFTLLKTAKKIPNKPKLAL